MNIDNRFGCLLCAKSFKTKDNLRTHINKHNNNKPYCCTECPAKFFSQSSLINHKKVHTGVMKLNCPSCDLVLSKKNNLIRHIKRKHSNRIQTTKGKVLQKKYSCHICCAQFTKGTNLRRHLKNFHGEKMPRQENKVRWEGQKKLKTEKMCVKKEAKSVEPFKSQNYCEPEVNNQLSLFCGNGLIFSAVIIGLLICIHKHYRIMLLYKRHLDKKQIDRNMTKKGKVKPMVNWMKREHKNSKECKLCGKVFKFRNSMLKHERKHSGVKVSCKQCGKNYADIYNLKIHSCRSVSREEMLKYLCTNCGKGFVSAQAQKIHQNTFHLKISVGSCYRCGREFYDKSPLSKHLSRKTCQGPRSRSVEERTVKSTCDKCHKVFSKPGNLRAHVKHHHFMIRPFKCSLCGKEFIDRRNLNVHHRKLHPGLPDDTAKFEQGIEAKKEDI